MFTPGVEVFSTSELSSTSATLRKVCLSNLPSVQLQREIQTLIFKNPQIYKFDSFRAFNTSDQLSSQLSIRNSSPSVARLLQIALGNEVDVAKSLYSFLERQISLTSYFPPVETSNNVEVLFHLQERSAIQFALQGFLQYFIILTNDGLLSTRQIQKGIEWLSMNLNDSFLSELFSYKTTKIKTFIRKIFPAVVAGGNIRAAKYILEGHIDILNLTNYRPRSYFNRHYTQQEKCMSTAVRNGDSRMVELLCTAGFSLKIIDPISDLPWNTMNFETLKTLLSFGADPECFIVGRPQGYPLIDAAKSGSLEAVNILLEQGSRVNFYVKDYFGTALQAAVWAGHLEMAKFLIAWGADINAPFGTQYQLSTHKKFLLDYKNGTCWSIKTPIQISCAKNNIPLAELLLNYGADVNLSPLSQIDLSDNERHYLFTRGGYKFGPIDYSPHCNDVQYIFLTALQHSVQNGNMNLSRLLLSNRANPNLRALADWGDTAIQLSIRLGYLEITQILVDFGADVNASPGEVNGRTALQAAAEIGNIELAQMLLKRNAELNALPGYERGLTALQAAIRMRHPLMAGFLLFSGADINAPPAPTEGLTAIQGAAEIGDLNLINDLIRQGGDINNETAGIKAMLASISRKNLPMLELLVKYGAQINSLENENYNHRPPIIASAMNGWIDGVHYLLDNGADIDYYHFGPEIYDMSPLACAINNDDIEMTDLLLTRGASLYFPLAVYPFNAPLCLALYRGCSVQIIDRLIDEYAKADPFHLNQEVLAVAVCSGYDDDYCARIVTVLKVISKLPKTLYMAQVANAWNKLLEDYNWLREFEYIVEDAKEVIKLLLKAGADINFRYPSMCFTLLQRVIRLNNIELAKFLIAEGAEIQVPASSFLGTPLQEAIRNNEIEFVHFLLERDVDINAPPAKVNGVTALQAAARNGNRNLALVLLERGAKVNAPPAESCGMTAVQAAAINGYIDIAVDLLRYGAHVAAPGASNYGRTAIDGAAEHGHDDMLHLLLNHYDGCEGLSVVCERAATYAEKEGHGEIASWLRQYPSLSTDGE